jgi:hypothetical protein
MGEEALVRLGVVIFSFTLIFWLIFSFPEAPLGEDVLFLTAQNLWLASLWRKEVQFDLRSREFWTKDMSFSQWGASDVVFSFREGEEDSAMGGKMGLLEQESAVGRTRLSGGVELFKKDLNSTLLGEVFIWDATALTLESIPEEVVRFLWEGGEIEGRQFLWNQRTESLFLKQGIKGVLVETF